ncbi:TrmH family RNA methyltransferase [Actinomycetospora sp. CA-101289]|uniref:TrmH family RNA methyltransferase n=1 Tax=Actinomycetospora sp. CA-101289 TaxID=3239893 RepID=UPI003D969DCA
MTDLLTERTPRVAAARKLLRRAARVEAGRFLVEGVRPVHDVLDWADEGPSDHHRRVHDLFLTSAVADRHPELERRADAAGIRVARVTDKAAAGLSDTVTPQGVVAVCATVAVDLATALADAPRLVTVLVGVADPGNAGTVVRTSDAAGADAVVLAGDAVDPHNPKCVRASMGSLFHVPVAAERDVEAVLDALRARGLTLLAADGHGDTVLDAGADALLGAPTAWLFGSEAHGLDPAVAAAADHRVRVPIHGRAESLNLATAAAVCLYASARVQR